MPGLSLILDLYSAQLNTAQKINVQECFSERSFGCLELFTENLTAEKMWEIYKRGLLKSADKMCSRYGDDWVLQEDNDPKHRSRLCTTLLKKSEVKLLNMCRKLFYRNR